MMKPILLGAFFTTLFCASSTPAAWPTRVFAPYMYIGFDDNFKLTDCDAACGQKYFTLAFFIARQERQFNPANAKAKWVYQKEPTWDGTTPIAANRYADQINAIRQRGGDVIASFGGEAGKELAIVETDPVALEAEYQSVIDQYHFSWLDFDIEGNNLDRESTANQRRNLVLALLQKKNPGLIISYTLPVDPNGISDASQSLLKDAAAKGISIHSANLMVMYFGKAFVGKGKSEADLGIESAIKAHGQIQSIDPNIKIGLCPALGENGSKDEIFALEDARTLKEFADKTPWICSLHYWSINDDAAPVSHHSTTQPANAPFAFANVFKSFTTR